MGMYIFRNVGPDAMKDIRDGKAKLTDEELRRRCRGAAGHGRERLLRRGLQLASSRMPRPRPFLTGKAAMKYDGTWLLSNINDEEQNQIGVENVGFMPFPAVDGGEGSIDQWPANAGAAMAANPKTAGPKVAAWFDCIAENYGQQALSGRGRALGLQGQRRCRTDIPETTTFVQEKMAEIDETVLWFEALLDAKSNSLASTNVSLLTTGQMTPEQYMADLQASVDAAADPNRPGPALASARGRAVIT